MKFHVNPATGEAGKCSAENGGCPFGDEDNHYTSKEAARAAFEKTQEGAVFSMSLKDMNSAAKTTDDRAVIKRALEKGSERTLANLAKNPYLTQADAETILERTANPVIRAAIFGRQDLALSVDKVTPADLEELAWRVNSRENDPVRYPTDGLLPKLLKDPALTEAHYDALMSSSRAHASLKKNLPRLLGEKNRIPAHRTREYLELSDWHRYPLSPEGALLNGKLSEKDLVDAPESYIDSFSAVGPSPRFTTREVDMLARVAVARDHKRLISRVLSDDRISPQALKELVEKGHGGEEAYKNPNATPAVKKSIEAIYPQESFVRVGKLKERIGQKEFDSIATPAGGARLNSSGTYRSSSLQFDLEKVKKYQLSQEDIFYMAKANSYNAGVSYDPKTGVFTGAIDSSG